jgi:hypothetical protein
LSCALNEAADVIFCFLDFCYRLTIPFVVLYKEKIDFFYT